MTLDKKKLRFSLNWKSGVKIMASMLEMGRLTKENRDFVYSELYRLARFADEVQPVVENLLTAASAYPKLQCKVDAVSAVMEAATKRQERS